MESSREPPPQTSRPSAAPPGPPEMPRWTVEQILQGAQEALILHGDATYRLRLTRSGKLLLFK